MLDNMIGKAVTHKIFGPGTIILKKDKTISVQFADKSRWLEYPGVFEKQFLKTDDTELIGQVTRDIEGKKQEKELLKKRLVVQKV